MSKQTPATGPEHDAIAQFNAQSEEPTEVRNTKLAAALCAFGHLPREIDGAEMATDENGKEHVNWYFEKQGPVQGLSTGQVCNLWEGCKGASAHLEKLVARAVELEPPGTELGRILVQLSSIQYVSQIEAMQVAFEEYQWLMQILRKLKASGNNQFTIERRGNKVGKFGIGMSEETILEMKGVAKF